MQQHAFDQTHVVSTSVTHRVSDHAALAQWLEEQREAVRMAEDYEPTDADDFELSLARWLRAVPRACWPMAMAWFQAILKIKRDKPSAKSLRALRGVMRRDVNETVAELRDASPAVVAAWRVWYPRWVQGRIADLVQDDPDFLLPCEAVHAKALKARREAVARSKLVAQLGSVGRELVAYANERGGLLPWEPNKLREDVRTAQARKPTRGAIRKAADALVSLELAEWKLRASGHPWALQILVHELPEAPT